MAAHRQSRPWSGGEVAARAAAPPAVRSAAAICAPATRGSAARAIPHYTGTFVFDNDHPCVGPDAPRASRAAAAAVSRIAPATGIARVVCYSPRHDVTLAELDVDGVDALLATWQEQMRELGARPEVAHVLIFENKGEAVGVVEPASALPDLRDQLRLQVHRDRDCAPASATIDETGRVLFEDVLAPSAQDGRRILREQGERDRVRALLRALRVRGLRRAHAERTRRSPRSTTRERARPRRGAARRGHPLRQPVEDAVSRT